jgi:hypothetical protein
MTFSTKSSLMNHTEYKESLFNDFFRTSRRALEALESQFNVKGVIEQVFGTGDEDDAKTTLRASRPWATLSRLIDYAIEGLDGGEHPTDIVIDGSDVIQLCKTENNWPSDEWDHIIAMGDGRFALDDGMPLAINKLALLARVDIRTVRNAISAGELASFKKDDGVHVENASARAWLHGRRGFKPTVVADRDTDLTLHEVSSPSAFAGFLLNQRQRLGLDHAQGKIVALHPLIHADSIAQLEAGIFTLPLDTVMPLADYYQVNRKELLDCVMRVFFYEEMQLLSEAKPEDHA